MMAESEEKLKNLLMKVKDKTENVGLKLNIKQTNKQRLWHQVPSLDVKYKGKKWKQWQVLFTWAPKSLWTVTETMKL